MISFASQPRRNNREITRVRDWVQNAVPEDDGILVMVNELECNEPGCAPIETVVTLLYTGSSRSYKIFKPVREVTLEEAIEGLKETLGGTVGASHRSS